MTPKTLNRKLIDAFPHLKRAYKTETSWQEGDDTGSHVVFADVLVPVMLTHIKSENYSIVKKYFDFLESLLESGDTYASDVVATSVIESIFYDEVDAKEVKLLLGTKSLEIWEEYEVSL